MRARAFAPPKAIHPGIEARRVLYSHALVRTKSRQHLDVKATRADTAVVFKIVSGIVGGADHLDFEMTQQPTRAESFFLQQSIAVLVDARSALFIQNLVHPERVLEFHVGPMVEGIAQGGGHGARPDHELLLVGSVTRDQPFRNAVGAQGAPFVVVPLKPESRHVGETAVRGDILGREMTVVGENGHGPGPFMVKRAGHA